MTTSPRATKSEPARPAAAHSRAAMAPAANDAPEVHTHRVLNQPPPLEDYDPYGADPALREGVERYDASWATGELADFARLAGHAETLELGHQANRHPPELRTHDRFGHRIDEVAFHPAWHRLMEMAMDAEIHALPWNRPRAGAHVARAAKHYLFTQVEAGIHCPLTMTFAALPALRHRPELAEVWQPRITSRRYDRRMVPADRKSGCLVGMAMTEKQGGSDVRANTTRAEPARTDGPGAGAAGEAYRLTGHKWFCSAPMSDAFLTLAWADGGLTCFFVPRFTPDGERNRIFLQRLKDKLGNRSNASSEIEYRRTWALRVGDEGRGVPTILEMVNHTRLDCVIGSAALMRQALVQAMHHATHRRAFGRTLREQPLMRNVLADLALEVEAATALMLRLAASYDRADEDAGERSFRRVATAIAKYWVCKRGPVAVAEALECLGGNGYVEESILPRLYREIPLNSIWEGSGNVMCLDVLRALAREPETLPALAAELGRARGADARYDAWLGGVERRLGGEAEPSQARRLVADLALALQASLLLRHGPPAVADAFCASRLDRGYGLQLGALESGTDFDHILQRTWKA